MRSYENDERVRVVKQHLYRGETMTSGFQVGDEGRITDTGTRYGLGSYAEQLIHVQMLTDDGKKEQWIQIDCLEPVDVPEDELQATLNSIRQASEGALEASLHFDEIIFSDERGERYVLRPLGDGRFILTNEKSEFELNLDRRSWKNLSGLAELALNSPA